MDKLPGELLAWLLDTAVHQVKYTEFLSLASTNKAIWGLYVSRQYYYDKIGIVARCNEHKPLQYELTATRIYTILKERLPAVSPFFCNHIGVDTPSGCVEDCNSRRFVAFPAAMEEIGLPESYIPHCCNWHLELPEKPLEWLESTPRDRFKSILRDHAEIRRFVLNNSDKYNASSYIFILACLRARWHIRTLLMELIVRKLYDCIDEWLPEAINDRFEKTSLIRQTQIFKQQCEDLVETLWKDDRLVDGVKLQWAEKNRLALAVTTELLTGPLERLDVCLKDNEEGKKFVVSTFHRFKEDILKQYP